MKPDACALLPSISILLVDDFEPWRRSVCSMLMRQERLQVVAEAADGPEAVRKAVELHPDVILLDIGLPYLDGIEAASRIAQLVPEAKILFLTQNDDLDLARAALSNGGQGYVLKAQAGSELLPAIEAVLRDEKFVSTRVRR